MEQEKSNNTQTIKYYELMSEPRKTPEEKQREYTTIHKAITNQHNRERLSKRVRIDSRTEIIVYKGQKPDKRIENYNNNQRLKNISKNW